MISAFLFFPLVIVTGERTFKKCVVFELAKIREIFQQKKKKKKSGRSYQAYEIGKAQKLFPVENDPNFSFSFIKWLLLMYSQGTMTLECCNERLALLQISS